MKLINAVEAHMAAEELSGQTLPYPLALALVKVKRATADEAAFFLEEEQKLVAQYADLDEDGRLRMIQGGRFVMKDPAKLGEYEAARRKLAETDIGTTKDKIQVAPPEAITPAQIEALEPYLEFVEGAGRA